VPEGRFRIVRAIRNVHGRGMSNAGMPRLHVRIPHRVVEREGAPKNRSVPDEVTRLDGDLPEERGVREVFHLITNLHPAATSADLRPARHALGLTITAAADALGCSIQKISRIERGHIRDTRFLHENRTCFTNRQHPKIAAWHL